MLWHLIGPWMRSPHLRNKFTILKAQTLAAATTATPAAKGKQARKKERKKEKKKGRKEGRKEEREHTKKEKRDREK